MILNLNTFLEQCRQTGKTVGAAVRYLYLYNFGTTNAKMAFLHKSMDGSKDNLQTVKDIRDLLPPYLIMKERVLPDGKVDKGRDSVTMMVNPFNNNNIKTFASATNKAKAASLLRGKKSCLFIVVTQCLKTFKLLENAKSSLAYNRNRKIETNREIIYAEIKSLYKNRVLKIN